MTNGKKDILIIMGRYLPGYKDGGPVRSIKNLVDFLGEEYNFKILTCDRDHGDTEPYANIQVKDWNRVGDAQVYYVPPSGFKFSVIKKLANSFDLVYICGCFNGYAINSLILKRFNQIKVPVVVASMGLFSPKAFEIKYRKKKLFVDVFNLLGLFENIYWSATSEMEVEEIRAKIKTHDNVLIAQDLPRQVKNEVLYKEKKAGVLDVVWISRIAPEKNLLRTIEILKAVNNATIHFTIYGTQENSVYWESCASALRELPSHITWRWAGELPSEQVVQTLKQHQVFLFLTKSENYGHVIQEALSAGCPCILSDQTPWQDLEENGIGFVYPLESEEKFIEAIDYYAALDVTAYNKCANAALQYAVENSNEKASNTGYRKFFEEL